MVSQRVAELIEALSSPSGNGLKAFFYLASEDVRRFLEILDVATDQWGTKRGIPGYSGGDHGPGVEIYTSHRFFAVTEQLFPGRPDQIAILDWKQLERLAALIPRQATQNNRCRSGRDNSRSAKAFREGKKLCGKGSRHRSAVQPKSVRPTTQGTRARRYTNRGPHRRDRGRHRYRRVRYRCRRLSR